MKFKKSILALTLVSAVSFPSYAFAAHEIKVDNYGKSEINRPVPYSTEVVMLDSLSGKYGSCSRKFEVSAEKPFFKLWLYNTCGTRITYTVTKDTDYGEVAIGPYTLEDGEEVEKFGYKSINDGGTFYVNVTSSDGRDLSGSVGVRTSSTFTELQ